MGLSEKQKTLWNEYQKDEEDKIRNVLLNSLSQFINSLISEPQENWSDWVYDLSCDVIDNKIDITIRTPLFEQVIFPVLFKGYSEKTPNFARLLAGFSQYIYKSKKCKEQFKDNNFQEHYLLEKAVEHNPKDHDAKKRLIKVEAYYLDFSIHEVPWGVLYGNDGASINECKLLLKDLASFCVLVDSEKLTERYVDLINDCEFHYNSYIKYLENREIYESYEDFLNKNSG